MVAGRRARVAAVGPRLRAGLPAAALAHAVAAVADPPAAVAPARQGLVARQAAGNVLQVAGDVAALLQRETPTSQPQRGGGQRDESGECYLVLSHTPFLGEVGAGGALLVTVAIVKH